AGLGIAAGGATALRVRTTPRDGASAAVEMYDPAGAPVAVIERVSLRPLPEIPAPDSAKLHALEWVPAASPAPQAGDTEPSWAFLGAAPDPADTSAVGTAYADLAALRRAVDAGTPEPGTVVADCPGADVPEGHRGAREIAHRILALAQEWVRDERFADSRLVLRTSGAVAAAAGDRLEGLEQTPAWGLLRAAQSEHPGRFVLIDDDAAGPS
ncbi:hypothetical protein ACFQZ2_23575, partial [Streptomonospora algeriensis]